MNAHLNRLQRILHFAARLVSDLRKYDHVGPALAALGWPIVMEMVAQHDSVNVHRALHVATSPEALQALFRQRSAVSALLTRATAESAAALELPADDLAAALSLQSSCGLHKGEAGFADTSALRPGIHCLET